MSGMSVRGTQGSEAEGYTNERKVKGTKTKREEDKGRGWHEVKASNEASIPSERISQCLIPTSPTSIAHLLPRRDAHPPSHTPRTHSATRKRGYIRTARSLHFDRPCSSASRTPARLVSSPDPASQATPNLPLRLPLPHPPSHFPIPCPTSPHPLRPASLPTPVFPLCLRKRARAGLGLSPPMSSSPDIGWSRARWRRRCALERRGAGEGRAPEDEGPVSEEKSVEEERWMRGRGGGGGGGMEKKEGAVFFAIGDETSASAAPSTTTLELGTPSSTRELELGRLDQGPRRRREEKKAAFGDETGTDGGETRHEAISRAHDAWSTRELELHLHSLEHKRAGHGTSSSTLLTTEEEREGNKVTKRVETSTSASGAHRARARHSHSVEHNRRALKHKRYLQHEKWYATDHDSTPLSTGAHPLAHPKDRAEHEVGIHKEKTRIESTWHGHEEGEPSSSRLHGYAHAHGHAVHSPSPHRSTPSHRKAAARPSPEDEEALSVRVCVGRQWVDLRFAFAWCIGSGRLHRDDEDSYVSGYVRAGPCSHPQGGDAWQYGVHPLRVSGGLHAKRKEMNRRARRQHRWRGLGFVANEWTT
ncbi:hypothetical protein C8R45DRAFT_1070371 [Mycena sanguinolenta]|nr:hypothetical protein C8R45DRAFT_1070371 [Mycena sanguinolenta]